LEFAAHSSHFLVGAETKRTSLVDQDLRTRVGSSFGEWSINHGTTKAVAIFSADQPADFRIIHGVDT
jgi:hypothetical protein